MADFNDEFKKFLDTKTPEQVGELKALLEKRMNENTDSYEWDTPSKGGAKKIYFNSANKEDALMRVNNYFSILEYIEKKKLGGQ